MRRRISIRGRVRSSFRPSVRRSVPCHFRGWKVRILGASCAVYPALFNSMMLHNSMDLIIYAFISLMTFELCPFFSFPEPCQLRSVRCERRRCWRKRKLRLSHSHQNPTKERPQDPHYGSGIEGLMDWLNGWLIDWIIDRMIDWMINSLND